MDTSLVMARINIRLAQTSNLVYILLGRCHVLVRKRLSPRGPEAIATAGFRGTNSLALTPVHISNLQVKPKTQLPGRKRLGWI